MASTAAPDLVSETRERVSAGPGEAQPSAAGDVQDQGQPLLWGPTAPAAEADRSAKRLCAKSCPGGPRSSGRVSDETLSPRRCTIAVPSASPEAKPSANTVADSSPPLAAMASDGPRQEVEPTLGPKDSPNLGLQPGLVAGGSKTRASLCSPLRAEERPPVSSLAQACGEAGGRYEWGPEPPTPSASLQPGPLETLVPRSSPANSASSGSKPGVVPRLLALASAREE